MQFFVFHPLARNDQATVDEVDLAPDQVCGLVPAQSGKEEQTDHIAHAAVFTFDRGPDSTQLPERRNVGARLGRARTLVRIERLANIDFDEPLPTAPPYEAVETA